MQVHQFTISAHSLSPSPQTQIFTWAHTTIINSKMNRLTTHARIPPSSSPSTCSTYRHRVRFCTLPAVSRADRVREVDLSLLLYVFCVYMIAVLYIYTLCSIINAFQVRRLLFVFFSLLLAVGWCGVINSLTLICMKPKSTAGACKFLTVHFFCSAQQLS